MRRELGEKKNLIDRGRGSGVTRRFIGTCKAIKKFGSEWRMQKRKNLSK